MNNEPYTYQSAGFNGFLRRSIDGRQATTLRELSAGFNQANNNDMNFDAQQVTGSIGDKLQVGKARIDGVKGRFSIVDDTGNDIARFGDIGE